MKPSLIAEPAQPCPPSSCVLSFRGSLSLMKYEIPRVTMFPSLVVFWPEVEYSLVSPSACRLATIMFSRITELDNTEEHGKSMEVDIPWKNVRKGEKHEKYGKNSKCGRNMGKFGKSTEEGDNFWEYSEEM